METVTCMRRYANIWYQWSHLRMLCDWVRRFKRFKLCQVCCKLQCRRLRFRLLGYEPLHVDDEAASLCLYIKPSSIHKYQCCHSQYRTSWTSSSYMYTLALGHSDRSRDNARLNEGEAIRRRHEYQGRSQYTLFKFHG